MQTRLPAVLIVLLIAAISAILTAKPVPEAVEPPMPLGVWSGGVGEREAYRVIVTERDGRIVEYLGVWTRTREGWSEVYCPPGRECGAWKWAWDGKAWQGQGGWVLRTGKADF